MICGAKNKSGKTCNRTALHNGRCEAHGGFSTGPRTLKGKAVRAACARSVALRQWDEARADGRSTWGDLSPEGRAAIVDAAKEPKPAEQREKIRRSMCEFRAAQRYGARLRANQFSIASVFVEPKNNTRGKPL